MPFVIKVFLVIILVFNVGCSEPSPQDFNSEVWKSKDYEARAAMVNDINNHHLSKIQTKSETLKLLGEPEYKLENESEERWRYKIIMLPRCRFIWTCVAEIRFDKETGKLLGEVVSYD